MVRDLGMDVEHCKDKSREVEKKVFLKKTSKEKT